MACEVLVSDEIFYVSKRLFSALQHLSVHDSHVAIHRNSDYFGLLVKYDQGYEIHSSDIVQLAYDLDMKLSDVFRDLLCDAKYYGLTEYSDQINKILRTQHLCVCRELHVKFYTKSELQNFAAYFRTGLRLLRISVKIQHTDLVDYYMLWKYISSIPCLNFLLRLILSKLLQYKYKS
jgi:hypothetical protein